MEDDDNPPLSQLATRVSARRHDFSEPDESEEEEEEEELAQTQPLPDEGDQGQQGHGSMNGNGAGLSHSQHFIKVSKHGKYFKCPVHGQMRMDPHLVQFIDTRHFQRLRHLQQLGLSHYVFPGASHTRFEHCLGVAHLAFQHTDRIWDMHRSRKGFSDGSVDIRRRDILSVGLAGLCHDLGHGPFSHVWDHEFCKAKGIKNWKHEEMSCKMFDHMRDKYHIDTITDDEASLVKRLIMGERDLAPDGKAFLFDIVANNRNSIDVDKIDYLPRDAMHCGVKVGCDFQRLMTHSKVISDQVCYKWSEWHNVEQLFLSRLAMHRQVYTHRKAKAVELMVVDALVEADQVLNFSAALDDPAKFVKLDDTVLRQIEDSDDDHPCMRAARNIIERLRDRKIYKFVNEAVVPSPWDRTWTPPTAAEICSHWHSNGTVSLDPEQVLVNVNHVNWAMKDKNPLDHVSWFYNFDDTTCTAFESRKKTNMMTANFQETMLRVYSKNRDVKVVAALNVALLNYCRKQFGGQVELATPCHGKAQQAPELAAFLRANTVHQSVIKRPPPRGGITESIDEEVSHPPSSTIKEEPYVKPPSKRRRSLHSDLDQAAEGPTDN